jgi:hypothetical protein
MVCRRRWYLSAMLLMAALPSTMALAAIGADDFESADPRDLPKLREDILKAAPPVTSVTDRDAYASTVVKDFTRANAGINSKKPEVRLNAAILIQELNTFSTDGALIQMLQSSDPALRYWGARGLGDKDIVRRELSVGPTRVITALCNAGKVETSGVVVQEIISALSKYQDVTKLVDVLEAVSNQMSKSSPDVPMLQSVAVGLEAVAAGVAGADAKDKVKAATVAARLASFAAQQEVMADKLIKSVDKSATLPAELIGAVEQVVKSATRAMGAAAGKQYPAPQGSKPEEVMLNVNMLVGTPGGNAGNLQKDLQNVPVPPVVAAPE